MFLNYNELGPFSLYFDMNKSEGEKKQKKTKKQKKKPTTKPFGFHTIYMNCNSLSQFLPERFYNKTLATVGVITICHICLNLKNFLTNKKKIADRKERLSLNLNELKEALKDVKVGESLSAWSFSLQFHTI